MSNKFDTQKKKKMQIKLTALKLDYKLFAFVF